MPRYRFNIKGGRKADGELEIEDRGDTEVSENFVLRWTVKDNLTVDYITSIRLKSKPNDVVFREIKAMDEEKKKWRGVIKNHAPIDDYCYSIFWMHADGSGPHEHDPKIAVKPPEFLPGLLKKVLLLLGFLFIYKMFSGRQKGKK